MNQVVERMKAPTPKFFVNMRWIVGILGAAAVAVNENFDLHPVLSTVLEIIAGASSGSFLTTFFPVKSPKQ